MRTDPKIDRREERILVLAPSRRDAPTVAAILESAGIATEICCDLAELCRALEGDAGAALIAEEVLVSRESSAALLACLERQPAWSEPPVLVVTAGGRGPAAANGIDRFAGFANIILLERPLRSALLISAVRSALRARRRQFQVRDHLRERALTEERLRAQERELRGLAETLEQRVRERTAELEEANRKLLAEMEQRRQAEQALHQAQKMEAIGQLTGGIAHDFNNLLMVVLGGINMLERGADPARRERILGGIRQAAVRGEALTRQLLAFSRRMELSPEATDLPSLLDRMRILIAGALRDDIAIDIRTPADLWPVMADPTQLELAVLNTVANARDAMPDGGTLTIEGRNVRLDGAGESGLRGEFVRIEIRDTGTGIPPEVLDRIFDPFFTTKAVGKGTGLGLSQVYGFAKQSGGHVGVRSRLGAGTSIVLHLPRADGGRKEAEREAASVQRFDGRGRRVLLVEDNDQVAMLAVDMLEGLGLAVCRVASAVEALAVMRDGRAFDLVFSDILMPGGMSGVELAREIRGRHPDLPILLTTGYSDAVRGSDSVEGFRLLRKPYGLEALEAVLNEIYRASAVPERIASAARGRAERAVCGSADGQIASRRDGDSATM